ncbi:MAG: TIGR03986 family CRISPR-associated RAMP protein [Candidatus Aminicenantes bacterium]|jgi:CRISPR-associated protein (TIGR03986 family)
MPRQRTKKKKREFKNIEGFSSGSQSKPQKEPRYPKRHQGHPIDSGCAPYNFIPLNDKVVDVKKEEMPDFDRYHDDRFTGEIQLEIENKTPLYIRDTMDQDELKKENHINPDFFSPAKRYRIPGSSLRGMVRTLVEIVSWSKLRFFEKNREFHYRSFADSALDLRDDYTSKIIRRDNRVKPGFFLNANAGYLVKRGLNYKIIPAQYLDDFQFARVEEETVIKSRIKIERPKEDEKGKTTIERVPIERMRKYHQYKEEYIERRGNYVKNPAYEKPVKEKLDKEKVYGFDSTPVRFTYTKFDTGNSSTILLCTSIVTQIRNIDEPLESSKEGYLVLSGWMIGNRRRGKRPPGRGKHLHWVIAPPNKDKNELVFADGVIENYINDSTREDRTNLLKKLAKEIKKGKKGEEDAVVPCFYKVKDGKVISFGHTGLFRLAYEKSLEELVPSGNKNFNGIDMAEAIFGNESTFAGRVFFEDAPLKEGQEIESEENPGKYPVIPKILATPKPTTFQHYLKQQRNEITPEYHHGRLKGYRNIKNYNNSDAYMAGYKLYWHRSPSNGENRAKEKNLWEEEFITFERKSFNKLLDKNHLKQEDFQDMINNAGNKDKVEVNLLALKEKNIKAYQAVLDAIGIYETQHTKIKPMAPNTKFKGKIRFENLSKRELGALLFVLDLPEGCCHKLGMGKPLGMGSIKIKPTLYISNRKTRYKSLIAEFGDSEKSLKLEESFSEYKKEFVEHILDSIGLNRDISDLWETGRLKELRAMLDFNHRPEAGKTRYMEIQRQNEEGILKNGFAKRHILKKPSDLTRNDKLK